MDTESEYIPAIFQQIFAIIYVEITYTSKSRDGFSQKFLRAWPLKDVDCRAPEYYCATIAVCRKKTFGRGSLKRGVESADIETIGLRTR